MTGTGSTTWNCPNKTLPARSVLPWIVSWPPSTQRNRNPRRTNRSTQGHLSLPTREWRRLPAGWRNYARETYDRAVVWSAGPLVRRSAGLLVRWSAGPLVCWSAGPLVRRSAGPLVRRFAGPRVRWSAGPPVRRSAGSPVRGSAGPLLSWMRSSSGPVCGSGGL